jgi:hypothetical protein
MASAFKLRIGGPESFRTQARGRLVAILTDLDETFGPIREVDVIAYSLGSMIAIDTLTSKATVLEDPSTRIRLVTLGSPYRNVFQYYFPHLFPDLTRERLASVSEAVNVFRVNDYVGTRISRTDDFVKDRCQPPRGHLGYFSDREVIKEIVDGQP